MFDADWYIPYNIIYPLRESKKKADSHSQEKADLIFALRSLPQSEMSMLRSWPKPYS